MHGLITGQQYDWNDGRCHRSLDKAGCVEIIGSVETIGRIGRIDGMISRWRRGR